jgi:hypothetical protein
MLRMFKPREKWPAPVDEPAPAPAPAPATTDGAA